MRSTARHFARSLMKVLKGRTLVWAVLLLAATTLAYMPCLRGGFLWDDDAYISQNTELTNLQGLRDIWLKPGSVQQYYPLTFSVFWVEHHLWGLHPLGYHLVNTLLHGANAWLIGIILQELSLPGAWITAWLFALHPIQAESVAWMTELKNVLSTFFYLLTLAFLLKDDRRMRSRSYDYGLALLFFLGALLSNSITVTLPVSFLLLYRWWTGSWDKRKIQQLLPFIGIGLCVGGFTLYFEHHVDGAQGMHWVFSFPERLFIAGRAFWFYAGKLLWPSPIVFIYPRWPMDPHQAAQYVYPASVAAFLLLLAYGRMWWGKIPFACFLFFVISLGPVLGFTSFYFMRYSFVADHFQYLAGIGVLSLMGWAISNFLEQCQIPESSPAGLLLISMLLFTLALATCRAAQKYKDPLHLWQETVISNPYSAFAHHNLGIALTQEGDWRDALMHLRIAETLDPSFPQTHVALGFLAAQTKHWKEARREYAEAIRLGTKDPQVLHDNATLP
jgi:hypothetical protein